MNKSEILRLIQDKITEKINYLDGLIADMRASNNDTKSSMGDKYETSREMLQQEINRLLNQIQGFVQQKEILKKINDKVCDKVEIGSLVETDKGWFYISVSLGEILFENHKIICISSDSPLAKAMANRRVAESFSINQMKQTIKTIL